MSKNVLVGVDGLAREAENLWVGVDGKARRVKSAYVGVNGVARKIWPKIVYVWNRYNIEYDYTRTSLTPNYAGTGQNRFSWYKVLSIPNGVNNAYAHGIYESDFNYETGEWDNVYSRTTYRNGTQSALSKSYIWIFSTTNYGGQSVKSIAYEFASSGSRTSSLCEIGEGDYYDLAGSGVYVHNLSRLSVYNSTSKQGSTLLGRVTSENRNTYPTNGISGNYWYVYQGTQG